MTRDEAFARLARSKFRSRFKLTAEDRAYVGRVGTETIRRHAEDFVREKLAPAEPRNDGRQTPMRGHPVFKAMHGSAMCCRGWMEQWWKVRRGVRLTEVQQLKAVEFLMAWIAKKQDEEASCGTEGVRPPSSAWRDRLEESRNGY